MKLVKNNKIKILFRLIILTVLLLVLGFLVYLYGVINAGKMFGKAIHQSEIEASKYDTSNNPEACKKSGICPK